MSRHCLGVELQRREHTASLVPSNVLATCRSTETEIVVVVVCENTAENQALQLVEQESCCR